MAKVDPRKMHIPDGDVVVRVGADMLSCPKGADQPIYPVIELIWSENAPEIGPPGGITIRWQDKMDADKPSKSAAPKYIGLMSRNSEQWVGYRVSDKDRQMFESLRKKWGMWFLRVSRQDDGRSLYWTMFNDGAYFPGSLVNIINDASADANAGQMRRVIDDAWMDAEAKKKIHPDMMVSDGLDETRLASMLKIPAILEELGGGPLPWVPKELPHWGRPSNKTHDEIVAFYLRILGALKRNAENKKISEKFQSECGKMYSILRQAKIFEIAPEAYVELHLEVDRYVTEEIADLPFHDPRDEKVVIPEGEGTLLYRRQMEAVQVLPFPEKFPFDVCWFAIAGGVALSDLQIQTRGLKGDTGMYLLAGILAGEDGEHHELLLSHGTNRRGDYIDTNLHIVTHRVEEESSWQHQLCLAPFVLHALIDGVNDHQTTIVAQRKLSLHSQSTIRKGLGDLGLKRPIPPPFYTVYLRDKVIKEVVKGWGGGKLRAKYAHRFDVRGHWCFKIYRGQMPMDAEMELYLDKLRYNIFKNKPLDEVTIDALCERGQPPRADNEWIAIKKFWRNSYVKGPEDGQYVPSTRKATKGVIGIDNGDSSEEDNDPDERSKTAASSKVA